MATTDDYPFSTSTTGTVTVGIAIGGNIEVAGDKDMLGVSLTAGLTYVFSLARSAGGLTDPFLQLFDPTGTLISQDDNSGADSNAKLIYTAPVTGRYFLGVMDAGNGSGGYVIGSASNTAATDAISVSAKLSTISEGDFALYTVTAPLSLAGTTQSYSLTGVTTTDVQVSSMTGQYVVGSDGHATISVPVLRDATTEGTETLTVVLPSGSTAAVQIMDTSRPVLNVPTAAKTVLGLYTAFHGTAPNATVYASEITLLNSLGESGYAAAVAARFATTPTQSLAGSVLNNVKITSANTGGQTPTATYTALRDALTTFFDAFPQSRGQVILNLTRILPTIESNQTWGPAAIQFDSGVDQMYSSLFPNGNTPSLELMGVNGLIDPAA